ncbi:hypothetical protein USB125703_01131 [Pseudoclavibacter triregionum]|nr:hypothetical protein USB125703_01131 [Pseudoclavibacter triregionum]
MTTTWRGTPRPADGADATGAADAADAAAGARPRHAPGPGDPIQALQAAERLVAYATSARALVLAALHEQALARADGLPGAAQEHELRSAAAEAGLATGRSERATARAMTASHTLLTRFTATHAAWARAEITQQHAEAIARHGAPIDDEHRRALYEAAALEAAREHAPGRLDLIARRLAEEARELPLDDRHRASAEDRRVWVDDAPDGMSYLTAYLPTVLAHAIRDRLHQHAVVLAELPADDRAEAQAGGHGRPEERAENAGAPEQPAERASRAEDPTAARPDARRPDPRRPDPRTLGARMADTLADLLLTADAAQIATRPDQGARRLDARIAITVPVLSLLGTDTESADLAGVGPIPLDIARELAAEAPTLARILTDPIREVPLAVDRYAPSAAMRATLAARDRHCRFPGCRRPAPRCDLDHTIDAAHGGPTALGNLAHLCRWHHTLKHHTAWTVRQHADGHLDWTSPTGRTYTDRPHHTRPRFTAAAPHADTGPRARSRGGPNAPGHAHQDDHRPDGETAPSACDPVSPGAPPRPEAPPQPEAPPPF